MRFNPSKVLASFAVLAISWGFSPQALADASGGPAAFGTGHALLSNQEFANLKCSSNQVKTKEGCHSKKNAKDLAKRNPDLVPKKKASSKKHK